MELFFRIDFVGFAVIFFHYMNNQANPNLALVLHYTFKMLSPIGGIIAICLGYEMFINGVNGDGVTSLIVGAKNFQGRLTNAAPGLVIAIGGLVVIGIAAWRGVPLTLTPTKLMANVRVADREDHLDKNPVSKKDG